MTVLEARQSRPLEGGPSFPIRHRMFRAAWAVVWLLLAVWTPPPMHRWRNFLLRCFGANVHPSARIYGTARIWYPPNLTMSENSVMGPRVECYCMDRIVIGEKAVVSQGAHLCAGTHDIGDPDFQLITRPVLIGARAWVAAEAFLGPGVVVGEGAVIGARAVLFQEASPYGVYVGNPAKLIKRRELRAVMHS